MTDEQYQILTSYLRGHSELASLTHDDLARWLNEHKINTGPGPLSIAHVLRWAAEYAVIPDLETAATKHPAKQVRAIAKAALLMLQSPQVSELHLEDPAIQAMLDALVQAGVISTEARSALLSRAAKLVPVRETLGLPEVWPGHIESARRMLQGA
ncbi:MAG: hypothetical protein KatS3mg038_1975 [Candidatus Kapaibacterium sp.]|nr:MAG: hypothetical protein KatS3mg038_1975 [Candidatus Kapabacteria bacterium]